jgi:hypothetical protein
MKAGESHRENGNESAENIMSNLNVNNMAANMSAVM